VAAVVVLGACDLAGYARDAGLEFALFPQSERADDLEILLDHSSGITNHHISWNVLQPTRTTVRTAPADRIAALAEEHELVHTAMHFAWDQALLDDLAPWVLDVTDPDELRSVLHERAALIFDRYPGIDRIDVVNEPLAVSGGDLYPNHFFTVLGPDYVAELFAIVAAHAPSTTELIVNENFVEYFPAKADGLVALVEQLVVAGAPIDGVGLQSHLMLGEPDWELFAATIARIEALGLDVHLTELDVPVAPGTPNREQVQVDRYARAVQICTESPACRSVTIWGITDRATWYDGLLGPGQAPLLFDASGEPKPAYFAVAAVLLAAGEKRIAPNSQ
jgi:endo-1,4-beta-xylanase